MDMNSLKTFVEVMRRGNFATVAKDHDLDPSSVSRVIAGLEQELGLRLFHRTTRKLSPTEAALVYFDRVEPLVEELERARLKAVDISERPKGLLRIAAPVSFALLNIVPLLPEFAWLYPEVSFDLILNDKFPDLLEERIDVAVRISPVTQKGLEAIPLAPMIARVCASPAYLKKRGHPKTPEELVNHDCLLLTLPGFADQWKFRKKTSKKRSDEISVDVRGRLHTSNAVALKACALADMGLILQARWITGHELREGTLIDVFPNYEVTAATFDSPNAWLIYPSKTYLPLKVSVFVDFLQKHFRDGPPWDKG
jgi:DNA-binding transcriptional LysR family regulator